MVENSHIFSHLANTICSSPKFWYLCLHLRSVFFLKGLFVGTSALGPQCVFPILQLNCVMPSRNPRDHLLPPPYTQTRYQLNWKPTHGKRLGSNPANSNRLFYTDGQRTLRWGILTSGVRLSQWFYSLKKLCANINKNTCDLYTFQRRHLIFCQKSVKHSLKQIFLIKKTLIFNRGLKVNSMQFRAIIITV